MQNQPWAGRMRGLYRGPPMRVGDLRYMWYVMVRMPPTPVTVIVVAWV